MSKSIVLKTEAGEDVVGAGVRMKVGFAEKGAGVNIGEDGSGVCAVEGAGVSIGEEGAGVNIPDGNGVGASVGPEPTIIVTALD